MNFNEEIRQIARTDSRRFAKGTVCRILADQPGLTGIIGIMLMQGIIPRGINIDSRTGWDKRSGRMFVIPLNKWADLKEELKNFNPDISQQLKDLQNENLSRDQKEARTRQSEPLTTFLKQNTILITVRLPQFPDNKILSPLTWDVLIETLDVSQSMNAQFVQRPSQNVSRKTKWSDNH